MKLTKENYELLMFDLLEGNLPEKDALKVMEQIENNEFFFNEWKLFKSTVLVPDTSIVFEQKDLLYKSDRKIIPITLFYRVAVAASVILAIGIAFYQMRGVKQDISSSPQPAVEDNAPEIQDQIPVNKEQNEQVEPKDAKVEHYVEHAVKNGSDESIPTNAPIKPQQDELQLVEKPLDNQIVFEDPIEVIENRQPDQIGNNLNEIPNTPAIVNTQVPDQVNIKNNVTLSKYERIRGIFSHALAKVSDPHIKFIPEWSKRKLNIEVETNGYLAVATVDPFNKK